MSVVLLFLVTFLGSITFALAGVQKESRKSADESSGLNVLIILSEDHGPHLGCYGDEVAYTPNLDRLAERGVRFTNAYVPQATCSPSRASLLTGAYPQQHGQIGLSVSASHYEFLENRLSPHMAILPKLLRQNGFRTGVLGKIHINPHDELGFEFMRGSNAIGSSSNGPVERPVITQHGEHQLRRVRYSSDVMQVVEATREFFSECDGRPFFLYVATGDVHPANLHFQIDGFPARIHQPEFFADRPFPQTGLSSLNDTAQRRMAAYYNGLDRLDVLVGFILDELDEAGHSRETLVIFLSDHGPSFPGAGSRGKMSCYEGGLKVPLILYWPGQSFPPVFDAPVSSIDILPTILTAFDMAVPDYAQGKPLQSVLSGEMEPHRFIFGEFNRHTGLPPYGETFWPIRSVRYGDSKLIFNAFADVYRSWEDRDRDTGPSGLSGRRTQFLRYSTQPTWEYYDLAEDPYELDNRYGDSRYAETIAKLKAELSAWQESVGDFLLDPEAYEAERARAEAMLREAFGEDS